MNKFRERASPFYHVLAIPLGMAYSYLTWMTPPPLLSPSPDKNASGKPSSLPIQSMTTVSNSVQAGLDTYKTKYKVL